MKYKHDHHINDFVLTLIRKDVVSPEPICRVRILRFQNGQVLSLTGFDRADRALCHASVTNF